MTTELLDISGKLDDHSLHVIEAISEEAKRLSIPFLIVGAAARDMLMHHYYGIEIQRATEDVDIAVDVANWKDYQSLTANLINQGFKKTRKRQRLKAGNHMLVDIVPFGAIADSNGDIQWPPDQAIEMNVLGFEEALISPVKLKVRGTPELVVPVVSIPSFLLLKLIAWGDRAIDMRPRDAIDIKFIIQKYASIEPCDDSVWNQTELIEKYEGDIELVAAQLLGRLVSDLANADSTKAVEKVFQADLLDTFCTEMSPRGTDEFDENRGLMDAFVVGFNST